MPDFIKIHPKDNVAVALRPLPTGFAIELSPAPANVTPTSEHTLAAAPSAANLSAVQTSLVLSEPIPQGHKFALCDIFQGEAVIKYGYPIGIAQKDIPAGSWIHTHNLKTGLGEVLDYTYQPVFPSSDTDKQHASPDSGFVADHPHSATASDFVADHPHSATASGFVADHPHSATASGFVADRQHSVPTFMGFRRPDGSVGVRNELWIIPTVGCVNNVAASIAQKAAFLATGTIDGVFAFPHPYGCSQMGEDQEHTRTILADLIRHPNAGGVLVLGLGCENSNIEVLKEYIGSYDPHRVRFLTAQESEDEIADALKLLKELADYAGSFTREPISCKELIIGMKCGGSDGLSGITANPTVGRFSDLLIAQGGTTILTEVPEMFGAETLLMNRCETEELFDQTVSLINDFKQYFMRHDQTIYENPSPGNKKGGISTLEDKSLGCTQKSGSAPVRGVLSYGERVRTTGLNLLSAPGNDLVASTALAASGAHIVLFTTGRGTPFAAPVPTIKIATNSALNEKKKNWIDFNCGCITEDSTIEEMGERLFEYVLAVASGKQVCAERAGYHDMAIFKQGVTL